MRPWIAPDASSRHFGGMVWTAAPPIVRALAVVAFLGVAASLAFSGHKAANPQYGLLAVASLGIGSIVGAIVLSVGKFLTRPNVADWIAHFLRRDSYTRQTTPILLHLGILAAIFVMFALNLVRAVRHGDTLSGWTAAVLAAIIFYPMVRYRIERGRWAD